MSIESSYKLLEYVNRVSKVPMIVNSELFGHAPPSKVTIRPSFFLKDSCNMCGKCCPNETTAWTAEGYTRLISEPASTFVRFGLNPSVKDAILAGVVQTEIDVNGKLVPIWVHPADSRKDAKRLSWLDRAEVARCHWLFEVAGTHRCSIHPVRSITCGLPHVRFIYTAKTNHTTIGTSQFGRNFRLKCPIEFKEVDEQSTQTKIMWLKRLNDCANDFGVPTFLPEIIDYLDNGGRHQITFNTSQRRKLF